MAQNIQYSWKKYGYVFIGVLIMLCLGTVYSWSVFRPYVEKTYALNNVASGFPYMISLLSYAVSMFFSGKYINRINPSYSIALGGILVGLGFIGSAWAPNIIFLTLSYGVLIGFGVGIVYGVPMDIVAHWFPQQRGLVVGIVLVGFGMSPLLTAPIAKALLVSQGLQATFNILGFVFILLIPIFGFLMKFPPNHKQEAKIERTYERSFLEMMKQIQFRLLYILFFIGTAIGLTIIGMSVSIGKDFSSISATQMSMYISLFAVTNGIGRPLYGYLIDRFSHVWVIASSFSMIIVASVLMYLFGATSQLIAIICLSIFWMNLGAWLAIAPALTVSYFGIEGYSRNYGYIFTGYGIAAVFGVYISAQLHDIFQSYPLLFIVLGLSGLIGLMITFYYRKEI